MARKPKIPEHANHERWLVSYADFITLLFAFFTVLYATAQTDAGKIKKFVGAAERAFSAGIFSAGSNELMVMNNGEAAGREIIDLGMNLKDVEKKISQELHKNGAGAEGVHLERHAEGLTLQLQTRSFFKPGSDILRPEALAILPGVVKILKASRRKLRIEGHTDDAPIHNDFFQSNWELSTARALAVLRFLIRSQIPPDRMSVAGLAEFQPLDSNTTQRGRSRNRRVEIVILNDKPSFWANLKKPDADAFAPLTWRALITHDRIAPPAPPAVSASPTTAVPKEETFVPSPEIPEEGWRPVDSPPPPPRGVHPRGGSFPMRPLDPAPGSGHMHVTGHLPFRWRALKTEEADCVRSQILDQAVARSWTVRPESHMNVPEDMGPIIRRLNEIEEKLDRLLLRFDRADAPPLPVRPVTLGTENCLLPPLPDETFPPDGEWAEIRFILPPHDEDEIVVLAKSKSNGAFDFVLLAQDQMDHLVRYLLNRQRLAQEYPKL